MAEWTVEIRQVEVFNHPNGDTLELARTGNYQFVVQKGLYQTGDRALVIPEKSILTGEVKDRYQDYLTGPNKDRVKSIKLRGESSLGILMSLDVLAEILGSDTIPDGDLASILGITKYEPPIPTELYGKVRAIKETGPHTGYSRHDVEHFDVYRDYFQDDDLVIITEKIHGSQAAYTLTESGEFLVSSKGLFSRGLVIEPSENNAYWQAAKKVDMQDRLEAYQREIKDITGELVTVQAFGEVVPVQGGNWTYGLKEVDVLLFDVRHNGNSIDFSPNSPTFPAYFMELWVPIVFMGRFGRIDIRELAKGREQVSGRELHIREGVVIRHQSMQFAKDGTRLFIKSINPKYKESGEEIS